MKKVIILGLALLILGCTKSPIILDGIEVNDYNGTDLSGINDFRENSIKGPQNINISEYKLKITGLVTQEKNMTYEQALENQEYTKIVKLNCVEGWSVTILWTGILVKDLIKPTNEANTIIFKAIDGYTTSFPLDYVLENNIILAYKMNNVTIPPERGYPFQLVAEDKWGYKWIKWVNEIELSNNTNYEGYWEERGYSNTANTNESMFK